MAPLLFTAEAVIVLVYSSIPEAPWGFHQGLKMGNILIVPRMLYYSDTQLSTSPCNGIH